jgi:hypothetical protein
MANTIHNVAAGTYTTLALQDATPLDTLHRPETFRLPRQNQRDPYWGLSRAWYYNAEKAGLIKLIRLRKIGNVRGVTLVPYGAMAQLIENARG